MRRLQPAHREERTRARSLPGFDSRESWVERSAVVDHGAFDPFDIKDGDRTGFNRIQPRAAKSRALLTVSRDADQLCELLLGQVVMDTPSSRRSQRCAS
jgi:hypothetical protein